jgi:hypothetical protein
MESDLQPDAESTGLDPRDRTSPVRETRFDSSFAHQARGHDMDGTTAEIVELPRERFAYWAFDLLFLICTESEQGEIRRSDLLQRSVR